MRLRFDQPSSVAGEVSPLLYARADTQKFQSGAAVIFNMVVTPEGARQRRSGTRFVAPLADESAPALMVPFDAGGADSYMLVFTAFKMRVYKNGGVVMDGPAPYELATPFAAADFGGMRWVQTLSTLFFAWAGWPRVLTRNSDVNWTLADYAATKGPVKIQNTDAAKTIVASAVTGTVTLTAASALFEAGHVGGVWKLQEEATGAVALWRPAQTYSIGFKCRWKGRIYQVISGSDSGDLAPTHDEGDVQQGAAPGAGCVLRFVSYDYGYVKIASVAPDGLTATAEVQMRLPDTVTTTPSHRWSEGEWCVKSGYPAIVTIVDQSLAWGRGNDFWLSEVTDIYSFDITDEDDSAVSFRLWSPDGKRVTFRWAINAGVLLLGSDSGEWVIRGATSYDRISINSRGFLQQTEGAAALAPVSVAGGAVFVGPARDRLYFAKFDFVEERITIQEFTAFARHMLRAGARGLAWEHDPYRVLWVLLDDGSLAAVTFQPDQEVLAWHRHSLDGAAVEAIAAVPSQNRARTELWLQTRRSIDGETRRYIEVLQPYFAAADPAAPTAAGAWMLDCALDYLGPPVATLAGLDHLEGETVGIFADGVDLGDAQVVDGAVTAGRTVSAAVVGKRIVWSTRTLDLDLQTAAGPTKGQLRRASAVGLHCHEAGTAEVSAGGAWPTPVGLSGGMDYGGPRPLFSGVVLAPLAAVTDRSVAITISGADALPFTLLGLTPEIVT